MQTPKNIPIPTYCMYIGNTSVTTMNESAMQTFFLAITWYALQPLISVQQIRDIDLQQGSEAVWSMFARGP